jgi:hypothetical protein
MPYFFFALMSDLGASNLIFDLLTVAQHLASVIAIFIIVRISERQQNRGYSVAAYGLLSVTDFSIMSVAAIFHWSL